ncbi:MULTISPECIES: molecular chaperone [Pseudomonas]|jgi:P pilus assembly chaperone PapD|uniref:fimbrial biogenesis chaperone n=1 Tax=Pseudomonas TaxID=286 RepID=UPI000272CA51|nr:MULTISPECIES: molecular chaperone [Pseudomonas]HEC56124.1 molecular chaperone [Gammaproteobacteria bacterium]AUO22125.1 molecular chaperone [Pseudomonas sp. NC02]EJF69149.1 putative fimbrial-like chaperone protein [Pseudomonas sp. Ag1]MBT1266806.1 molecular chaperone [Pseudomonas sp. VS38]MDQ0666734.1 fimbrial chaperone protein [Pseudomonas sp. W2I6]|eukprot:gene14835-22702_t
MRLKVYLLLALLPLWHSAANAAVTVGATRLIYDGASNEANLSVSNRDDTSPYLVQSWVSHFGSGNEESVDNFIVTPPLFRLDADKENILRIIFTGGPEVPQDRESLFLMNVKAIPAMSDDQKGKNVLQIALKTTIKLFYRPAGLKGSLKDAVAQVNWKAQAGALAVNNASKLHVVVSELKLNGLPITQAPDVLRPGEARELPIQAKAGDEVQLSYIDDYGSIVTAPVIRIH